MKKLAVLALIIVSALLIAACGGAAAPTPTPQPAPPTPTPPPMADKLIVYGDTVWFAGSDNPQSCIEKSRFEPGQAVGFRMTAVDPMTGEYVESAELTVHLNYNGKTEDVPMRYRGSGEHPHPGMWTGKWVVPEDASTGVVEYTVTAQDDQGRTGEYKPFEVDSSKLTVVSGESS